MTGDERFGLIHSYVVFAFGGKRDPRVPKTRGADRGLREGCAAPRRISPPPVEPICGVTSLRG